MNAPEPTITPLDTTDLYDLAGAAIEIAGERLAVGDTAGRDSIWHFVCQHHNAWLAATATGRTPR